MFPIVLYYRKLENWNVVFYLNIATCRENLKVRCIYEDDFHPSS
jgi:hypothetical protein